MTENKRVILKRGLQPVKTALNNKRLAMGELPFLKIFKVDSLLYFGAFTETIDMFLGQYETRYHGYGNYDYKRLDGVLNNVEDVSLRNHRSNRGLTIADGATTVMLANYIVEDDISEEDLANIAEHIQLAKTEGTSLQKDIFLNALDYMLKVNTDTSIGSDYVLGQLHFSTNNTFVVGTYHVTSVRYSTPEGIKFQISSDEASVLSTFLKHSQDDRFCILYDEATNEMFFTSGNDLLVLKSVVTTIPSRPIEIVDSFSPTTSITINTQQLLRNLNLTSLFLESGLDEIVCQTKNGVGTLGEQNENLGDIKGRFNAEGVPDFLVKFKLPLFRTILMNQNQSVADEETIIEINLEENEAFFEHSEGSTFCSIYVEDI